MNKDNTNKENNIIDGISISTEMRNSFIDYAMSTIVSRAIPSARDGLKPVHRRIIYAMNGLDMIHNKAFKKSARAVGEVIAKYHPHGDSSVYDALVRMAQPFSLRYPLVWGQGNFGSIDGDGAAAMRYTEAKLQKISSLMTEDIKKDTVDFQENYDGTESEPKILPGKIPNLLVNGSTGIAVGFSTSIPPHNLNEIIDGLILLLKNSETCTEDLLEVIQGPDFPTGGIIINKSEARKSYFTGRGRVIVRSKVETVFDEDKDFGYLIIKEIPYLVKKEQLITKIADLVKSKTLTSIADIKDESNRDGIRLIIKLKKGVVPNVVLNKLFKLSPLQSNFPIHLLALENESPVLFELKELMDVYISHQKDILVRRAKFDLKKYEERKHILEGLKIALDNIDQVISLIRKSKDNKEASESLITKFNLSKEQSQAILEMRLNRLTGLEIQNLVNEIEKLIQLIEENKLIINSSEEQVRLIIKMLKEIKEEFGDERRTEISVNELAGVSDEDLIPKEKVVVTLSENGYIKRLPIDEYRIQNRGGRGSRGVSIKDGDFVRDIIVTTTHIDLLIFTSFGKVFRIRAHEIPKLGKNTKGHPIVNFVPMDKGEVVRSLISLENYNESDLVFVTTKGITKRTCASEFKRINKTGKKAITLKEKDELLIVRSIPKPIENNKTNETEKDTNIVLGNSNGKAINFKASEVRKMGRIASGVIGMQPDGGRIVDLATSNLGQYILSVSVNGFGKLTKLDSYRMTKRGGKGVITINRSKAGSLVALKAVNGNETILVITSKGTIIRTELSQISKSERNAKGVTIVKLNPGEKIVSITISNEEEINNEDEQ